MNEIMDMAIENFRREFCEDTRLQARDALRLIVEVAERYPDAMLPTPLAAAIIAAKAAL